MSSADPPRKDGKAVDFSPVSPKNASAGRGLRGGPGHRNLRFLFPCVIIRLLSAVNRAGREKPEGLYKNGGIVSCIYEKEQHPALLVPR